MENKTENSIERSPRANNTRVKTAQRKPWAPPSMLDAPPAPDGFKHRWIRAEVRGEKHQCQDARRLGIGP